MAELRELLKENSVFHFSSQYRTNFNQVNGAHDMTKAKDINRIISSPYNPASNGKAESALQIMKSLLKKMRGNPMSFSKALLVHHETPVGPTY